jgi:putative thioredoxin
MVYLLSDRISSLNKGGFMNSNFQKETIIFSADEESFAEKVIQASNKQPVMVDFWAEWCAPCLSLAPALERVISEMEGRVWLAKVEVDDNMRLAGHYRLRGFPTVILFSKGEEIGRFHGSRASHWLRDWVKTHLPQSVKL